MRGTSNPHGTVERAVVEPRIGSVASSDSVMPACSFGSSRKYQSQTNTQIRLIQPRMMKEARQLYSAISQATSGGVTALPKRAKECVSPWAKPHRPAGVQYCIARVAVGNVAPSPNP